jgi:hypothetical protein
MLMSVKSSQWISRLNKIVRIKKVFVKSDCEFDGLE